MTPSNLVTLYAGEELLRSKSLRLVDDTPPTAHHLSMIEQAMNLIHALIHPTDASDKNQLGINVLGIRVFNALAATLKLGLSGYYQAGAAQLRDVLETAFLLDYFTTDRSLVETWRTAPDKVRRRQFSPVAVRRHLDTRDGFAEGKRGAAYDMFCRLAAHPNPESVTMLVPTGETEVHMGPFFDANGLTTLLAETALTAVQATQSFRSLVRSNDLDHLEAKLAFLEAEASWAEAFYGQTCDTAGLGEMRRLLASARQPLG